MTFVPGITLVNGDYFTQTKASALVANTVHNRTESDIRHAGSSDTVHETLAGYCNDPFASLEITVGSGGPLQQSSVGGLTPAHTIVGDLDISALASGIWVVRYRLILRDGTTERESVSWFAPIYKSPDMGLLSVFTHLYNITAGSGQHYAFCSYTSTFQHREAKAWVPVTEF